MRKLTVNKCLVLGEGISGRGAYEALKKQGVNTTLCNEDNLDEMAKKGFDLAVISPSVPKNHRIFNLAREKSAMVIGEVELGSMLCTKPFVAVTGTNGKTTTVELIGKMLSGKNACVTGNIGRSFALDATFNYDCFVVETSSFQLETIVDFKPKVAVITNISADHLDRHGTIENYAKTKLRIAENQTESDFTLLSADDINCELLDGFEPKSEVFFISTEKPVKGAYMLGDKLYLLSKPFCRIRDVRLTGIHNIKNALFASLSAYLMGATIEEIKRALGSFKTGEHRLKYLTSIKGVAFYDDSKGTNVSATIAGMQSMSSSFCLIAGGSDKGYEYDELFIKAPKSLIKVCAIGETAEKIINAGERNGFQKYLQV